MRAELLGIDMPDDFPTTPYDAVNRRLSSTGATWDEFNGGWTGLGYRFLAVAHHDAAFTESVARAGGAPLQPDRYVQERELFDFIVNGLSALESLTYALFAIGSLKKPKKFRMDKEAQRGGVTPETTKEKYVKVFPDEAITDALERLIPDSKELKEWKRLRNTLEHRATPGRHLVRGGDAHGANYIRLRKDFNPKDPIPSFWRDIPVTPQTTASRRA